MKILLLNSPSQYEWIQKQKQYYKQLGIPVAVISSAGKEKSDQIERMIRKHL